MTNLQAAVGLAQVEQMEKFVAQRRRNALEYNCRLDDIPGIHTPQEAPWAKNVYWMYGILVDEAEYGLNRDQLRKILADHGVETRTFFIPMHCQPVYWQTFKGQRYPVAENLCKCGFYLPSSSSLTLDEIEYIAGVIRQACPNLS
jgi:perosamine synthetase